MSGRRVVIESPYGPCAGDPELNAAFARDCVRDCLRRGDVPIATHLLAAAKALIVYVDRDITPDMKRSIDAASAASVPVEFRELGDR
jgi:hypothetical protein